MYETLEVRGAYDRADGQPNAYKNKGQILKDWQDNKDFRDALSGSYLNKQYADSMPDLHINVRYAHDYKVLPVK